MKKDIHIDPIDPNIVNYKHPEKDDNGAKLIGSHNIDGRSVKELKKDLDTSFLNEEKELVRKFVEKYASANKNFVSLVYSEMSNEFNIRTISGKRLSEEFIDLLNFLKERI